MWLVAAAWSASLGEIVQSHRDRVPTIDATTCQPTLQAFFDELEAIDPHSVDLDDVAAHGAQVIQDVFAYRTEVHTRLRGLFEAGELSPGCVLGARRADLAGRYLQDALYIALGDAAPGPWVVAPGQDFRVPERDLRAGDVIVSRADALTSAGIAHMGGIDGQFSHNVLIHRDLEGHARTVEAYIERGAISQPFEAYFEDHVARVVVLRYRDPGFAAEAARRAYARIRDGRELDYDAGFDYADHRALFCSEVVPWAFVGMMDDGPTDFPYDLTVFDKAENAALFETMGIEVDVTSAPSDILYDPRFDIVAEWRDVALLDRMRRHDVVVESLFTWMEKKGYRLESTPTDRTLVKTALFFRRFGLFAKRLHPRGDPVFLVPTYSLDVAGHALLDAFDEALGDDDTQMMTYQELRDVLEGIRVRDLEAWNAGEKTIFHERLHPAR
ncbi:MAG: hypothetical protein H6737_24835 [Alphaproteobacteria bacterium]|nr:hypothetical protein [Alphaproteobacteria bacterium]